MNKSKLSALAIGGGAAVIGLMMGVAGMASAQTSTVTGAAAANPAGTSLSASTATGTTAAQDPQDAPDVPGAAEPANHGHRPLGNDGVISSISGTTITIAEEADEAGAAYTVDASKATITNNSAAATLADLKVGDKVFVDGTVSGTSVAATSISLGHGGGHGPRGRNDAETNDDGASASGAAATGTSN